jgi:hypothetical protein
MVSWNLKDIGTAELEKSKLSCNFKMDAGTFFKKFSVYADSLTSAARDSIESAINNKREEKVKKQEEEISEFFNRVAEKIKKDAAAAAAAPVTEQPKEPVKQVEEKPAAAPAAKKEAPPKSENVEGEKIPIQAVENIAAKYEYNYPEEKKEGYGVSGRTGKLIVKNISNDQRIWDISGKITHNGTVKGLDEKLYIKELNAEQEQVFEYKVEGEKEPALKIDEFISTNNDPNTLTYALVLGQDNTVYFKVTLTNNESYAIKDIVYSKALFEGGKLDVRSTSSGQWKQDGNQLIWEIESMEAGATNVIEFTVTISVSDKEQKFRSGAVKCTYLADDTITEMKIDEFEAFGNNRIVHSDEQMDDNPDVYIGSLFFENMSPYVAKLKAVSIKELSETNEKRNEELVVIQDEGDVLIAPGQRWQSAEWQVDTKGEIPNYSKEASFILLGEVKNNVSSSVEIEDIELAVAIFEAKVEYAIGTIPSHRDVPFDTTHTLTNAGAAPFNYLSVRHEVPAHFLPPNKDDLKIIVDGKEYPVKPEWVKIDPDDQDRDKPHVIFIEIPDLKETDIGYLNPGSSAIVKYPLTASDLSPEEEFLSNCVWTTNTDPAGEPIVIGEAEEGKEPIKISVVHQRVKIMRGKSVLETADVGVYKVVLTLQNNSTNDVSNYSVRDVAPANFDAYEFSQKPSENTTINGKETMVWKFPNIAQGESVEVTYLIKPLNEDAHVADAQYSV